jgi:hypothetical protein
LRFFKVPRTRLELAHRNRHQPLKLACLPISPSGQYILNLPRRFAKDGCKSKKNCIPSKEKLIK